MYLKTPEGRCLSGFFEKFGYDLRQLMKVMNKLAFLPALGECFTT